MQSCYIQGMWHPGGHWLFRIRHGWRDYQMARQSRLWDRRRELLNLLASYRGIGGIKYGGLCRIAAQLGVSRMTVHRDLKALGLPGRGLPQKTLKASGRTV